MLKQEKIFFSENLAKQLAEAKTAVLVDYAGLTVKLQQKLKKLLKASGSEMMVVKNTLFLRSARSAKLPKEILNEKVLEGPSALVITKNDPIACLQIIAKFSKEFELPSFKVGVVEGNFQDQQSLSKLSLLPSKDTLSAQVVGSLSAPLYGIVGVLNANMQKLVYILNERVKNQVSS